MSARRWRQRSAAFVLPVALASGCLLVAPPDDLPPRGASGQGSQVSGGSAGTASGTGGFGGGMPVGGQAGEPNPEGGGPASGGAGGEAGASGGRGGNGGGSGGTRISRGGSGEPMGGAGEGGAPGCTTNKQCIDAAAQEPSRCRPSDGACVALKSNECPIAYGPAGDPNALYVASFAVLNPDNPTDSDVYLAERLAVDEINAAGGLPGGPGGSGRPLVLVVCTNDGVAVPDAVSKSMTHLMQDVQVPALIAMLEPDDLTTAFLQADSGLFFLNPVATLRRLTDTKTTKGLLWTLLGQPSDYAPAYHLLLADLEKQVHVERSLMASDTIKVALVSTTDAFNDELRDYVFQSLVFNGSSAAVEKDADNYREYTLDAANPAVESTVSDLLDFAPDVVISTAGDVMTAPNGVLVQVESGWPSAKPPPFYVLSPYNGTSDAQTTVEGVIYSARSTEPDAARRFLGVNAAPADDLTLENDYESRYSTAFHDAPTGAAANTDNYYDAVYYLAYALYASDPALTAVGISAGMKRLIAGDAKNDGPAQISDVFSALGGGAGISLSSTLGPPDFDATTGVRPVTPGVFCFKYSGAIFSFKPNALRYDATNDTFTGNYPCLANFPPP